MIDFIKEHNRNCATICSALYTAIKNEQLTIEKIASILNVETSNVDDLFFDGFDLLDPGDCLELFVQLNISPLWVLTEKGEPIITSKTVTGKILKTLNIIIKEGLIPSFPQYIRLLNICNLNQLDELYRGEIELDADVQLTILQEFKINPVYIYHSIKQTPVFV